MHGIMDIKRFLLLLTFGFALENPLNLPTNYYVNVDLFHSTPVAWQLQEIQAPITLKTRSLSVQEASIHAYLFGIKNRLYLPVFMNKQIMLNIDSIRQEDRIAQLQEDRFELGYWFQPTWGLSYLIHPTHKKSDTDFGYAFRYKTDSWQGALQYWEPDKMYNEKPVAPSGVYLKYPGRWNLDLYGEEPSYIAAISAQQNWPSIFLDNTAPSQNYQRTSSSFSFKGLLLKKDTPNLWGMFYEYSKDNEQRVYVQQTSPDTLESYQKLTLRPYVSLPVAGGGRFETTGLYTRLAWEGSTPSVRVQMGFMTLLSQPLQRDVTMQYGYLWMSDPSYQYEPYQKIIINVVWDPADDVHLRLINSGLFVNNELTWDGSGIGFQWCF